MWDRSTKSVLAMERVYDIASVPLLTKRNRDDVSTPSPWKRSSTQPTFELDSS